MTEIADAALVFRTAKAWRTWLTKHHDGSDGIWMKIAKKGTGVTTVTAPEVLDMALCFGWIDGQRKAFDDVYFLQRYTPRRARSRWSMINREKADALIASGDMHPAGQREIDRAKADGRWDAAYAGQASATVPEDLARALDAAPAAKELFSNLDSRNRYAILYRVHDAKRAETRACRIEQFVAMLERGEKVYPTPPK